MHKHLALIATILLFTVACTPQEPAEHVNQPTTTSTEEVASPDGHNSRNSLDWAGTYSGVLPCADCPGIETVITLRSDNTYERSMNYLERTVAVQTVSGAFTWDKAGNKITLDVGDAVVKYQVGENQLFHLDQDGQRISGSLAAHYVLQKQQ